MVADCGHGWFFVVGGLEFRALLAESLKQPPADRDKEVIWAEGAVTNILLAPAFP
jgi:hypothetical protein